MVVDIPNQVAGDSPFFVWLGGWGYPIFCLVGRVGSSRAGLLPPHPRSSPGSRGENEARAGWLPPPARFSRVSPSQFLRNIRGIWLTLSFFAPDPNGWQPPKKGLSLSQGGYPSNQTHPHNGCGNLMMMWNMIKYF